MLAYIAAIAVMNIALGMLLARCLAPATAVNPLTKSSHADHPEN